MNTHDDNRSGAPKMIWCAPNWVDDIAHWDGGVWRADKPDDRILRVTAQVKYIRVDLTEPEVCSNCEQIPDDCGECGCLLDCPSGKFSFVIGRCVKMAEALSRTSVECISFIPITQTAPAALDQWRVMITMIDESSFEGKSSISKGEALMSLYILLNDLIRKEIRKLQLTLSINEEL